MITLLFKHALISMHLHCLRFEGIGLPVPLATSLPQKYMIAAITAVYTTAHIQAASSCFSPANEPLMPGFIAERATQTPHSAPSSHTIPYSSNPLMKLASDLIDMLPPHPKTAGSTDLIRLLVTIARWMPLRSNLRGLDNQRVAWAHHRPRTEGTAFPSAILAASAILYSCSPYVGMGASRRGVLAVIAHPHSLECAATRHFIKADVIIICRVQLSDQLWELIS